MRLSILVVIVSLTLALPQDLRAEPVEFAAADGVKLFADWHPVDEKAGPTIVLLHQAGGSARGEYPTHIERLNEWGYHVLAVDLRNGGDRFGAPNRTVSALAGRDYGYCDALPDLKASAAEAARLGDGEVALWGSSYSAGLALILAADPPPGVVAVLAFSPAAPLDPCLAVEPLPAFRVPVAAFRPDREMVHDHVAAQGEALEAADGVSFHVIEGGVHGSSMLVPDRSGADLESAWSLVGDFLAAHVSRP